MVLRLSCTGEKLGVAGCRAKGARAEGRDVGSPPGFETPSALPRPSVVIDSLTGSDTVLLVRLTHSGVSSEMFCFASLIVTRPCSGCGACVFPLSLALCSAPGKRGSPCSHCTDVHAHELGQVPAHWL